MDSPKYCKYCKSEPMVRARRALWQKMLVPHLHLYKCRICGTKSLVRPNSFPDTIISPRRMDTVTIISAQQPAGDANANSRQTERQQSDAKKAPQGQLFPGAE